MQIVSHQRKRSLVPSETPTETVALFTPLRRLRRERGLTQTDLGRLIGVDRDVITFWETHQYDIPLKQVIAIAVALTVPLGDVLEWRYCRDGGPRGRVAAVDTYDGVRPPPRRDPRPAPRSPLAPYERRYGGLKP